MGWTAERISQALLGDVGPATSLEATVEARIAMFALQVALPATVNDVPVRKIVKIRRRYGADLCLAVEKMESDLGTELADIRDPAVLEAYLRHEVARRFERSVTTSGPR